MSVIKLLFFIPEILSFAKRIYSEIKTGKDRLEIKKDLHKIDLAFENVNALSRAREIADVINKKT